MIIVGLGSNKGDRLQYLHQAVQALKEFMTDIRCSGIYESSALLTEGAPEAWNRDFLNMAVGGETSLTPHQLLVKVKEAEKTLGRIYTGYWGPREIDIDILAYHQTVVNETNLTVPHRFLQERDFALVPLAEIAPDWLHPATNKTALQLLESLNISCSRFHGSGS